MLTVTKTNEALLPQPQVNDSHDQHHHLQLFSGFFQESNNQISLTAKILTFLSSFTSSEC